MKKVINRKAYNTKTAERIGRWDNGLGDGDFNYVREGLFITKKGVYFIAGCGGAMSKYGQGNGNQCWGGEKLWVVTKEEAIGWCEENSLTDAIEEHFADMIEDA